jgi:hypothetical protein
MTGSREVVAAVLGVEYRSYYDNSADLWAPSGSPLVDDPEMFGLRAQVFIGELGDDRRDSFGVGVCSPAWFAALPPTAWTGQAAEGVPDEVMFGSGWAFMRRWDQDMFERALTSVCANASPGPDWGSVATRISRDLMWDFDYLYDQHVNTRFGERFPPR